MYEHFEQVHFLLDLNQSHRNSDLVAFLFELKHIMFVRKMVHKLKAV